MRRGQQVEVLKTLIFGMPAQWVDGYTYVKADPRGGYLVRHSSGYLTGAEVRYPRGSVRPARLRKNDAYSPFPPDVDQLRIGTAIEAKEHGMSRTMAEKTAREHLAEDDQYYTKLAKLEGKSSVWGWDELFRF